MSNHREWDRDKEWDGQGHRGVSRGRDDDDDDKYIYGDGKRRRHNYGDDDFYEHPSSYSRQHDYVADDGYNTGHGHSGYDDDRTGNDWNQQDRERGAPQYRKKHVASEPSAHVIFLGLDPDFTEADLQKFLQGRGCTLETVTIIRDRNTGQSKSFGFAQFQSVEGAKAFVDPNFPFISVPPPASHGASAAAAFWKAEDIGGSHGGRRVKIDYSQSNGAVGRRGAQASNDGTRDIGNTQSAVLLLRGLDPLSGPTAIGQALKTSSGPNVEGSKGLKRIILIRDRTTMASWGYAFAEFVDVQSASLALAATMSPQLHPNGFRVSDLPIAVSFAHPYSFQPIADPLYQDEACIPSSISLGGVEGTWVKYWDEASTVALMEFEVEEPRPNQVGHPSKEKREKKRLKEDKRAGPTEASVLPVSDKPVTLSFNKGVSLSKTGQVAQPPVNASLFAVAEDEEGDSGAEGGTNGKDDADAKSKQAFKVPPMIASKKTVNNISKWTKVQEELSGVTPETNASSHNAVPVASASTPPKAKSHSPVPEVEKEFEFSNTVAFSCLLCSRQFKSIDQLKRHNNESELHKKNAKDTNLCELARNKVRAAKAKQTSSASENAEPPKSQYRDRASERRTLFNQPDVPLPENAEVAKPPATRRSAEGPPKPPSPPPRVDPGKDESNVGNKLLKMMGWTEGSGLGNDGEGRVNPVEQAIYASGAGLGASKGREVGKYQGSYQGYVQMGKDLAKERFND